MSHKKQDWTPREDEQAQFKLRRRSSVLVNTYAQLQGLAVEQGLYQEEKEAERFELAFARLVDTMQVPRALFWQMVQE